MRARRDLLQIGINLILIGGLTWFVWQEWNRAMQAGIPAAASAEGSDPRPEFPALRPPLPRASAYAEIVERPLFTRDRRPAGTAQAPVAAQPPAAIRELRLTGIVIGPDTRTAILSDGKRKKEIRLHKDENYKGWRLQAFADDGVVFANGGRTVKLPLVTPAAAKTAAGKGGAVKGAPAPRIPFLSRRQRMRGQ